MKSLPVCGLRTSSSNIQTDQPEDTSGKHRGLRNESGSLKPRPLTHCWPGISFLILLKVRRAGSWAHQCPSTITPPSEIPQRTERRGSNVTHLLCVSSPAIFLKWRAAAKANEVEEDVLIYWSMCACVCERGTVSVLTVTAAWAFLCDYTTTFQLTYLTDVFHKLDPFSGFAVPLFIYTHTQAYAQKHSLFLPHTRSFSFSPPSVFLFWRSFLCTSKSNIWVSLYLVEQDLQDIVGRMCELEQFTLWESPIYRYTQTCINTHTQTSSTHKMSVLTLAFNLISSCHMCRRMLLWQMIDLYFCIVRVRLYFQVRDTANTTLNIWLNAMFNILKRLQKQKRGDKS